MSVDACLHDIGQSSYGFLAVVLFNLVFTQVDFVLNSHLVDRLMDFLGDTLLPFCLPPCVMPFTCLAELSGNTTPPVT